jgi:7-carboxy-7-deazaguanine synthase
MNQPVLDDDLNASGASVAPDKLETLKLTEIFFSLQGEAATSGAPTVFVRLTGCPLRCTYCDSAYAFYGGSKWHFAAILKEIARYPTRYVCITGGEPLAQKPVRALMQRLCEEGYQVSLETSGALDISGIDPRVSRVMDLKTPDSKEQHRNRWENIPLLTAHDQLKFVLCSRADYDWAKAMLYEHDLPARCVVWFSPSFGQLAPRDLADWIVHDGLAVRMQLQLHKSLWGDVPGK